MDKSNGTRTEKGLSLARGPALVLGTLLLAAGLYFLYKQHTFPKFSNFPDGSAPVAGKVLFGIFGVNGWTGMLTAVCGGLLLFGAAQHLLAKTMSLLVGLALGAAAIIALISSNVLGMAAANGWTEIGWGIAAAILLFNAMIPRRKRVVSEGGVDRGVSDRGPRRTHRREAEAAGVGVAAGAVAEHHHDEHVREEHVRDERVGDEHVRDERGVRKGSTVAHNGAGSEDRTAVHTPGASEDQTVAHEHRTPGA